MPRSLSTAYVKSIVDILGGLGFDPDSSLDSLRLTHDALSDPRGRVALDHVTRLMDTAAAELQHEDIGLRVGEKFRVHTFETSSSVLAHAPSIAEAVRITGRYQPLAETVGRSALERTAEGDFMVWSGGELDQQAHRHVVEMIVTGYATTTHWLAWSIDGDVDAAYFSHAGPADTSHFQSVFKCPVHFEASRTGVRFSDGLVDTPLPSSSPDKLMALTRRLDLVLAKATGSVELREKLAIHLVDAIRAGNASEIAVAEAMGLSVRALQKRLRDEKLTFRKALDETRMRMTVDYMRDNRRLSEIAQILGYNDQAAFTKAFRRWYDMPPTKYRALHIDNSD